MNWRQFGRLARMAGATPAFLRRPVGPDDARGSIEARMAQRPARFLDAARRLIYDYPASPWRRLLLWAGWDFDDLRRSVLEAGVEQTLARLRDAGVRLSLEEFKRLAPIRRPGLEFEPGPDAFDTPVVSVDGVQGTTSGSHSAATRVMYDWAFIAEEAAHEQILAGLHGVADVPTALWYPVLPGVAGVHNLLIDLKRGHPPERWYSQIDPASSTLLHRLALAGIRWGSRAAGLHPPAPERATVAEADRVLAWILAAPRPGARAVRGFGGSLLRLADCARRQGADLTGVTLFTGGEPLTDTRRRFMESTGCRVFPRYVATEVGLIAAACPARAGADDMHIYLDRVAVIPDRTDAGEQPTPLLFTTLSPHTGVVLLNTDLGDEGSLSRRSCGCAFGRLGFDLHVREVRSHRRITVEGMTVPAAALDLLIGRLVQQVGGTPLQYQFRVASESGPERLEILVSPELDQLDEARFLASFHAAMARGGPGLDLAADIWRQAGTVRVLREEPRPGMGAKQPSLTGAGHAGPR